jgi:putative inorganic carbon (hco3(-)) transporter
MPVRGHRISAWVAGVALAALLGVVVGRFAPSSDLVAPLFLLLALLLILGALAWLAWTVHPAWTLTAALLLSSYSGNWKLLGFPGLVAPDRLVLAAGILAVALRAPPIRDRPTLRFEAIHWLFLAALTYATLSALIAGTLFDHSGFFRLLDRFGITPFLLFLVAPVVFSSARERAILLGGLVAWGFYLGLVALFETTGPNALVWPRYILDATVGIHADRARGPFVEAVSDGTALYACAVAAVMAAALWPRPVWRALAIATTGLCALGIVFTLTRSVWLGAVVATLLTMLASRHLRSLLPPAGIVGLALVAGVLAVVPGLATRVETRRGDIQTVWDRENLNAAALNMVEARPLLGFGWERFNAVDANYFELSEDHPLTVTQATKLHNAFLTHLSELGLIGTSLWLASLVLGVGGAILRRGPPELWPWQVGLLALAIYYLIVANAVYPLAFTASILWLWAGVARGPARLALPVGGTRSIPRSPIDEGPW